MGKGGYDSCFPDGTGMRCVRQVSSLKRKAFGEENNLSSSRDEGTLGWDSTESGPEILVLNPPGLKDQLRFRQASCKNSRGYQALE